MTTGPRAPGLSAFLRGGDVMTPAYLWVTGRRRWQAHALAGGLGVISNLAFPPIWFWPAMAVALSGLIWLIDGAKLQAKPGWAMFLRCFWFAFGQFLVGFHWIAAAFLVDPGTYLAFIWMAVLLMPGGLALLWAGCMRIGFIFWVPGPARLVVFVVFLTLTEWVRGNLFGGFPWNLPGMIWWPGGAISQSASIWGIYGLSALTVFAMASPGALADQRPRGATATRAGPVVLSAVIFGALWGWGESRLSAADGGEVGPVVRLVDTGAPQAVKDDEANLDLISQRFRMLSGSDEPGQPPIVIWPEGALPAWLLQDDNQLGLTAQHIGSRRLIVGTARVQPGEPGGPRYKAFNSLAVIDGETPVRGPLAVYDKARLVPFGEFTPLREIAAKIGIPTLQQLATDGFYAGAPPATMRARGVPPFGPLICYEAIFPGLSPAGEDRPRWLVNISNDSWFGNLSGPWQHAAQAQYRSIEEGLPMARVAGGGQTGMIDAYGRWSARGAPADPAKYGADPRGWVSSMVDAPIPPAAAPTPYSTWREGLFWIMLAAFNLGLLVLPRR
jgi:apolipoprotein N-acyltransferase